MAGRISWDATGSREYHTGVNQGVLYPINNLGVYTPGVAWNGITGVSEKPTGAEATSLYADNVKYLNLISAEEFEASVTAYMYPDEFKQCNGEAQLKTGITVGQQSRKIFGLCYKTLVGNDVDGESHGYKLHLVYGCQASPSSREFKTVNDSPDAIEFSWDIKTTPVSVTGHKPTATIEIDSTKLTTTQQQTFLTSLEDILYGKDAGQGSQATDPKLPTPDEIAALYDQIVTG